MTPAESVSGWRRALPWLLLIIASWMLLSRGLERDLNHDEHQFLAPGALLSREGLLPYRDYPLFHLPNLVFAYAAIDRLTDGNLLLGAKLLSIAASIAFLSMLVRLVISHTELQWDIRCLVAATGVILVLYDPVFLYTAGKTWNHEVPTALMVGALLLQARSFDRPRFDLAAAAGLLGGLSVGCRLTFGPMLIPLCVLAFLVKGSLRMRLIHGLCWGGGVFIGLLPSIWLWISAPEQFLFGNLEFPRLRLTDPTNTRIQKTMRWSAKFRYFLKEVMRPSWPLFLLFLTLAIRPGWHWLRSRKGNAQAGFALAVLPFALLGCFAPSRYQYQHFFGVIGVVAIGVVAVLPTLATRFSKAQVWIASICASGAAIIASITSDMVKETYPLWAEHPSQWFAFDYERQATSIASYVPSGVVLTLSPTIVLEGKMRIFPEFATGPFAWRSAHLLSSERAERLGMVSPRTLTHFLQTKPPAAVLSGVEDDDLELPLIQYAQSHGYRRVELERKRTLWIRPTDAHLTAGQD